MAGHTPLTQAAANGDLQQVRSLIENGADINQSTGADTALTWAAHKGHLNVVIYLVENGADIHITNNGGTSPLELAKRQGHASVAEYLKAAELKEKNQQPPKQVWQKLNTEEIRLTSSSGDIKLTHIFNMARRERIVVYKDSVATPQPFEQIDPDFLHEAFNQFTAQGGVADEAFVMNGTRTLKDKPQLTRG